MPDQGGGGEPGSVMLLSAEESAEHVIKPRLLAARADCSRVHIVDYAEQHGKEAWFDLSRHLPQLSHDLEAIGDVQLVIIDPIMAYAGKVNCNDTAEVRTHIMGPLQKLAERHQAAIMALSHLNKSTGAHASDRITGSSAFVNAVRAGFVVGVDPEDEERCIVLPLKQNLSPLKTGLSYTFSKVPEGEFPQIVWNAEPIKMHPNDLLDPKRPTTDNPREEAAQWLEGRLANGPVPVQTLKMEAPMFGHSWRTVERAKQDLGVLTRQEGFPAKGVWYFPGGRDE